eukprot:m.95355 g.95355  ORF g.95355 m.95355 type:complete len:71 (-) comp8744_c1_seq1:103-315(-)
MQKAHLSMQFSILYFIAFAILVLGLLWYSRLPPPTTRALPLNNVRQYDEEKQLQDTVFPINGVPAQEDGA